MRLPILFILCLVVLSTSIPIGKDENSMFYLQKFSYLEAGYRGGPASISEENVDGALKLFQKFARLNQTGTNMFQVVVHVFGQSSGMAPTDDRVSAMAPNYTGYQQSLNLDQDDVTAIRALLGVDDRNTIEREGDGSFPQANVAPNICQDPGDFYWEVLSYTMADGYPRRISDDWDGLVGNLDASVTWANGTTHFFKGEKCWRFTNKHMDPGYPKLIRAEFDGIPDAVDAALLWRGNGNTYFFKGNQYWQYDSERDPPVSEEYPRPITDWKGLPTSIDAAFKWEGNMTYFFKGMRYYRFDGFNFMVETQDPPYPRKTSSWWFGC